MRHPGADQVCHFGHKLPSFIEYSKFQNIHFPWYREAKRRATEEAEMEEEEEVEPERDLGSDVVVRLVNSIRRILVELSS